MFEGKTFCSAQCHLKFRKSNEVLFLFEGYVKLSKVECAIETCVQTFQKAEGEFNKGKWYCSIICL